MTMKNHKRFLTAAAAGIALGMAVSGCSGGGAINSGGDEGDEGTVYRWRLATHQIPGTARFDETLVPFVEAVEEASGGRLIIEPFGANVLFPTTETFSAVQRGTIEMAAIYGGYWTGVDPVFAVSPGMMPGEAISTFEEHQQRVEALQPIVTEAYAQSDILSLGAFDYGNQDILMSNVKIDELADFQGLDIRGAGIPGLYYSHLGASVVSLSAPEIYSALQLGTIDAAEYVDFLVNGQMGLQEVTDYVIEPALHGGVVTDKELLVNPEAWESLPKDLQQIVIDERDKVRAASIGVYTDLNEEAKQEMWIDEGVEFVELSDNVVEEARDEAADFLNAYKDESDLARQYIEGYAEVLFDLGYVKEAERLGFTG
jgi:TRAP-type mannitol/chloroaromatic compound transport system substrate-binding protein